MKVERFLYGMQTADGKILKDKTSGVDKLLTLKSQEAIRTLKPADSHKYLWFKTEQTVAYPVIIEVADKLDGGRTWVQNQTFITNIHEFFEYVQSGKNPFDAFKSLLLPVMEKFPDRLEAISV